ncbi:cytochrome c oxidase assembly protein [Amantichitinum ursilacus]|uniref:Cytochrome c oxidase assembly protein CtaG n=1 Tax=Amantichitinum ursilacus TaxID=857265 RepID=A0A0N0XFS0_9NEIS|nr:cytochrome c oxidase assembly protein [Amantichitinum ursilacus]KPC49303.1 Cytochrome c oxidase assembly protein CtaG [Amantichitinum ursilacus]
MTSLALQRQQGNRRTARRLLLAVLAMLGFSFAMVPFYNVFCRVMGIQQDRTAVADAPVAGWQQQVLFDSNVAAGVPMQIRALDARREGHAGGLMKARFELRNLADTPLGVRAVPSYAPLSAVRYVEKVQCFCFDAIHLAPREVREVTVVLVFKSDLPATLGPITLSYTVFGLDGGKQQTTATAQSIAKAAT